MPPERIREAGDKLLAGVRARLPERFWREPPWHLWGTAFIARMASTVETMMRLAADQRQADSAVLLRSLYEHMVLYAWISIDPDPRLDWWVDDARREMGKLHSDADAYDMGFLSDSELARARAAKQLPPLINQAAEVDDFWTTTSARLPGASRIRTEGDSHRARPLRRGVSDRAAAAPRAAAVTRRMHVARPVSADRAARARRITFTSFLAIPVFAMALLVNHYRLGWPDDDAVQEIRAGLLHDLE